MDPQRTLKRMAKQLSLTDDEKSQNRFRCSRHKPISLTHCETIRRFPDDEKHKKMRAIMQSTREQIRCLAHARAEKKSSKACAATMELTAMPTRLRRLIIHPRLTLRQRPAPKSSFLWFHSTLRRVAIRPRRCCF